MTKQLNLWFKLNTIKCENSYSLSGSSIIYFCGRKAELTCYTCKKNICAGHGSPFVQKEPYFCNSCYKETGGNIV